jgi:Mannosyltransferase (PIG-V)
MHDREDTTGGSAVRGQSRRALTWPGSRRLSHSWLGPEWLDAVRTGGGIWLTFSALRWVTAVVPGMFPLPGHDRPQTDLPDWLLFLYNWDSGFYADIATHGYFSGDREPNVWIAFFPGLPLAMRGLAWVGTFGDVTLDSARLAGVILAQICSCVATVLLYRLTSERFGHRAAVWSAVLLMTWPTAVFLNAVYTESLFLALAVGSWYSAWRGRWWLAGLLCAGASLTRLNGLLLAGALLAYLVVEMAGKRTPWRVSSVLAVAVGGLGTAGYFWYLYLNTGDWLAWPKALEDGWHRRSSSLGEGLFGTLSRISVQTDAFQRAQSVIDIVTVGFLLGCCIYLAWRRYWPELVFTLATWYTVAASPEYLSVLRYTLTLFPLFIVGGDLLSRAREWASTVVVTLLGTWMLVTTVLFTMGEWAG